MRTACRATAAGVQPGWRIDAPDRWAQLRVTTVSELPGGHIRIAGTFIEGDRKSVSYELDAGYPVVVQQE